MQDKESAKTIQDFAGPRYVAAVWAEGSKIKRLCISKLRSISNKEGRYSLQLDTRKLREFCDELENSNLCAEADKLVLDNLKGLLAFTPKSPQDEGFVTIVRVNSIVKACAMLVEGRENALCCKLPVFEQKEKPSGAHRVAQEIGDCAQRADDYCPLLDEGHSRDGYEVDYDRVVHSKSFRRLVDKA